MFFLKQNIVCTYYQLANRRVNLFARENQSTDTGDEYIRLCVNILTPLPPITVNLGPQMLQSQYRCFADWLISLLHISDAVSTNIHR